MDLPWRYGLRNIFLGIKLFCFSRLKAEIFSICLKLNFMKPHKISTHSPYSDNCYFHFFYGLSDWVKTLWGLMKFFFKRILKVSAFYLEKQKSFIPKKMFFKPLSISKQKKSFVYWFNFLGRFWLDPAKKFWPIRFFWWNK